MCVCVRIYMGVLERDQNPHKEHTRHQVSSSRAVMGAAYFPFCYYEAKRQLLVSNVGWLRLLKYCAPKLFKSLTISFSWQVIVSNWSLIRAMHGKVIDFEKKKSNNE